MIPRHVFNQGDALLQIKVNCNNFTQISILSLGDTFL